MNWRSGASSIRLGQSGQLRELIAPGVLLRGPAPFQPDDAALLACRVDEEGERVVEPVQHALAARVDEPEPEVEAPVRERQRGDVVAQLAGAVGPADAAGVEHVRRDEQAGLVAQLELELRRRDPVLGLDPEPERERLAREELLPLAPSARRAVPPRSSPRRCPTRAGPRRARPGRPRRRAPAVADDRLVRRPSNSSRPSRSRTARSQSRSTWVASCETKTIVPPRCLNSKTLPKHLRWKASSPTAKTSSSRRMSASRCAAIAKPSRMYIPEEYVRTGRSIARSSSAKATISSKRSRICARLRPWMAPFRNTFSRPLKSGGSRRRARAASRSGRRRRPGPWSA